MRAFPILVLASLCLTLLPLVPSATAAPPGVNFCRTLSTSDTIPPGCRFLCLKGDRIRVEARTTGPGDQYPRLRAQCGGVDVHCQSGIQCSATSASRATFDDVGTCFAETVYVDGTCTSVSDNPLPVPDPSPLVNYYVGWAMGFVQSAPGYADYVTTGASAVVLHRVGAGADAPFMCTTFGVDTCAFPCVVGDRIRVFVEGTSPYYGTVSGSATCGGVSVACSGYYQCQSTSAGGAGTPGVGTCAANVAFRARCTVVRASPDAILIGAVNTAVGLAMGAAATAQQALDVDKDGQSTQDELLDNSDPTSYGSRGTTDDDGDGVANRDERSRVHAMSTAVMNPLRYTGGSDRVTLHFGHAGARATVRSPEGHAMTLVYLPAGIGSGCPPGVSVEVPDAAPCTVPAVASFSLDGSFRGARRAYEPSVPVPASSFLVLCAPRADRPAACLDQVGADGTWQVLPATQSPRASTQPKAHAGFEISIQGKTFNDVAPDSGDINGGGSGQNTRDAVMGARLWNWHRQAEWSTYAACSGGLVAPCATESGNEENVLGVRQYL